MKRIKAFTVILGLCAGSTANLALAENPHDHTHHGHAHHGHDLAGPELGLSIGYVHLEEEGEDAVGVHAHVLQRLGEDGLLHHLAVGAGVEYIFSDEEHYALMLSFAAYPWRGLVLSVSPGVQWAEHEGDTEAEYATHLEAAYVFPFGEFDIGPVIDYSWTQDEEHYMLGLHFGLHL